MTKPIIAMLSIALAGCVAPKTYLPLKAADPAYAAVHLIRDEDDPPQQVHAFVDGRLAASIPAKSAASFSVAAGEHTLQLGWKKELPASTELRVTLSGGEARYFQVRPETAVDPALKHVVSPLVWAVTSAAKQTGMPIQFVEATAEWGQRTMKELGE